MCLQLESPFLSNPSQLLAHGWLQVCKCPPASVVLTWKSRRAQGNRRALRRGESAGDRTDRLLALLGDLGEPDLALAGCQENAPHMRFMDSDLTRLAGMAAAMADADAMLRAMGRGGGSFALMKYLPAMLLAAASPAASHQRYAASLP